jgi:hypothetical protein
LERLVCLVLGTQLGFVAFVDPAGWIAVDLQAESFLTSVLSLDDVLIPKFFRFSFGFREPLFRQCGF